METVETQDVWTYMENAPAHLEATANLFHWSTNYDWGQRPSQLFLDLIGWSGENIGRPQASNDYSRYLGYLELDYLADALKEYATRPQEVEQWIEGLFATEQEDDNA